MINLISGGHYAQKGYWYSLYLTFPEFHKRTTINFLRKEHKDFGIYFPTHLTIRSSNIYFNGCLRVLGFGFGLEIHSKIDNVDNN